MEDRRMDSALIASVGIDLGKATFHVVALDCHAKVILRKKFSRGQLLAFTANLPWSIIGMDACSGAALLRNQDPRPGSRSTTDSGAVRETVRQDQQKRLQRCRNHRGDGGPYIPSTNRSERVNLCRTGCLLTIYC